MDNSKSSYLTSGQFLCTVISTMMGTAIITLPNDVIKSAKQDGWMGCIIGSLYPVYMCIMAHCLCKKYPEDNIFMLSKKVFGNFFGTICNIIFSSFLIFAITSVVSGVSNLVRVYIVEFLNSYQVISSILVITAFVSYSGIKTVGKQNEFIFYLTLVFILIPIGTLKYGSILNIMPVFGSGIKNILISSKGTIYSYAGIEVIFLIYPFLNDKKNILKYSIIGISIIVFTYTWFSFLCIFYLGYETSQTYFWPVLTLSESINIPIINSFRYVFVTLWSLIALKCLSTFYFAASFSLNGLIKRIPPKTFTIIIYPLVFFISILYGNPTIRSYYIDNITIVYILFNFIYVTLITILIYLKKGDLGEKN